MMMIMLLKLVWFILLVSVAASEDPSFVYNYGFLQAKLSLDGMAEITSNGLLRLTNSNSQQSGHAFYSNPIQFKNSSSNGNHTFSFSTTFVFAIRSEFQNLSGHGIAFVIAPQRGLPGALSSHHLGLFNEKNNGDPNNHVVAVELDEIESPEFFDISSNHVGIDINSLRSNRSAPAMYFTDDSDRVGRNLSLISGKEMQVWIEYNGLAKVLNVTIAPIKIPKPKFPLLSMPLDLSPIIFDSMYVGFSAATGSVPTHHYIVGWSFQMNGEAQQLDSSRLPKLPRIGPKEKSKILTFGVPIIAVVLVLTTVSGIILIISRKKKFAEVLEQWELDYGPHRFSYKDLYIATKGFRDKELLGMGGFGRVYRGVLSKSKMEVAVKRVSHDSRQGMREFVAEIVSIGRLRHRNIVQLHGYCRRKGELLLVYDFMPRGSLDKYLYDESSTSTLNWNQRFRIIKGVASGLFYLHEEWEQVVIHRDIKASNVLLDGDLNGRLGDFGLARLYDHGTNPQTTHVVGTLGYLAPEFTRTGKATTSTDVFAFGAFLLEVACGRRPIKPQASAEDVILVDWVFSFWSKGAILETSDPNLGECYEIEEMEMVLKLGLLCSHSVHTARPNMRQVVQFLEGDLPLPDLSAVGLSVGGLTQCQGFDDVAIRYSTSPERAFTGPSSGLDSFLSTGR